MSNWENLAAPLAGKEAENPSQNQLKNQITLLLFIGCLVFGTLCWTAMFSYSTQAWPLSPSRSSSA